MKILGEYKSFWPGESSSPEVDKSRDVLHTYGVLPSPKNWLVTDLDWQKADYLSLSYPCTYQLDHLYPLYLRSKAVRAGDAPEKAVPDWKATSDIICKALEEALKQDSGEYDRPRIKSALEDLRREATEKNFVETVKKLCLQPDVAELMKSILAEFAATQRRTLPQGKKPPKKGTGLMGRKTKHMAKQLRQFKAYLDKRGFDGDESKLYGLAANFWILNAKAFNKAKDAQGEKRGYSSSKVLADACKRSL